MKSVNPESKHIAKAAQGNASTKALSKSLLFHPKKKNKKISPASQKLNQPTHKQTDQNNSTIKEVKQLTNNDIYTDEQGTTTHNISYTQAGGSYFVGQVSGKFKVQFFVESSVVKIPACV